MPIVIFHNRFVSDLHFKNVKEPHQFVETLKKIFTCYTFTDFIDFLLYFQITIGYMRLT